MEIGNGSNSINYARETVKNNKELINIKYFKNKQGNGKFNLLYININSLRNKLFELEAQIQSHKNNNNQIHFIALTEVRIFEYDKIYFNLPEYNVFFSTRPDGDGGYALFVHKTLKCEVITTECIHNVNTLNVNVIDLNLNIIVMYKQPLVAFSVFREIFNKHIHTRNNAILVGDMNINILSNGNNTKNYIDSLVENGFYILNKITNKFATRVAHRNRGNRLYTTKTIIDHIYSNVTEFNYELYLNDNPLSDHKEIQLSFGKGRSINYTNEESVINISKLNFANYNDSLNRIKTELQRANNFGELINRLETCKLNNSQTKSIKKESNPYKPWINGQFLNLIKQKKKIFHPFEKITNKCVLTREIWCNMRISKHTKNYTTIKSLFFCD